MPLNITLFLSQQVVEYVTAARQFDGERLLTFHAALIHKMGWKHAKGRPQRRPQQNLGLFSELGKVYKQGKRNQLMGDGPSGFTKTNCFPFILTYCQH